jgi:hypothetical protein
LSILQRVWGWMLLTLGVSTAFLAVGAVAVGWTVPGREMSAVVAALAFGVFAVALVAGGAMNAWAGGALRAARSRARTITMSLAVPNLFVLPFGTALGIYALWVLLHNETRGFFEGS